MIGIIVTGHGNLAQGLTSALELILGKQEMYIDVNFPSGDTAIQLEENIGKAIDGFKSYESIVVFADLLSGSPFNTTVIKAIQDKRIRVIYGVNLGMLVEAVMNRNIGVSVDELVNSAVQTGKTQIGVFNAADVKDTDDEAL